MLWADCFGGQASHVLGEGDYDSGTLESKGMWNDQVSSLKVWKEEGVPEYGSDGCWVATYEHQWD